MQESDFLTHHVRNSGCEFYERGDEWSHRWERVDCEDCWEKRDRQRRMAGYFSLGFGAFFFLWFVVFMAVLLA